jgi:hypothetical protein
MHLLHDRPRRLGFASSPVMAIGEDHFFYLAQHRQRRTAGTKPGGPLRRHRRFAIGLPRAEGGRLFHLEI